MERRQVTCGCCGGTGRYINWVEVFLGGTTGTMKAEKTMCKQCNGNGYTEHAVFSVEEAEVILKHCGLLTES